MSSFYKMDPAAWDFGTSDLSLEEEAAYLRIVNAIHKHDAPVPNNDRVLAGMFRSSTRKARALVEALLTAGKVVIEDGKIWNERARSDMVRRGFTSISRAESGAKGGRTRAENASKSLENNNTDQANASSRIEKNREDIYSAKAPSVKATRFDEFWEAYPHRGGVKRNRKGAAQKYTAAVKRGVSEDDLISAAKEYAKDKRVIDGFARDPTTWLNQEGWTDEASGTPASGVYDPQVDRWNYISKHGTSEGWRSAS